MIFPTFPLVKVDSKSTWVTNLAKIKLSCTKLSRSCNFQSQLITSQVVAILPEDELWAIIEAINDEDNI